MRQVLEEILNDSAAALILLEHHWAVPAARPDRVRGWVRISDGFIRPLGLVEIGLLSSEEAQQLDVLEMSGQAA